MQPLGCGSYAGGDPCAACTPRRSATARRKSNNAGSLSAFDKTRRRCPSLRMPATAWSTVSSRIRPSRNAGRARVACESRSLIARAIRVLPPAPFARKQ
eukprot:5703474-Alexandrium_andersonii.AAC.1